MYRLDQKKFEDLTSDELTRIGQIRFDVFIRRLGWTLDHHESHDQEMELDRFDRPGTRYALALDQAGNVVGCLRMIRTAESCHLTESFAPLLKLPDIASKHTWELSRLSFAPISDKALPFAVIKYSLCEIHALGGQRVVGIVEPKIERLYRMNGLKVHRIGEAYEDAQGCISIAIEFSLDYVPAYREELRRYLLAAA